MSYQGTGNEGSAAFNLDWEYASNGQLPQNAVEGGEDKSGEKYYVGRARHGGGGSSFLIPGKVQPSHQCIYYSFEGKEHSSKTYEVLVNRTGKENLNWVQASNGEVPQNAVLCGHQENNQQTYIGRHWHEGALVIGKVQPANKCLYIPFNGKEVQYKDYEILVSKETPAWNPKTFMGPVAGTQNTAPSSGPQINPWGGAGTAAGAPPAFDPNSDGNRR